ncbi:MAG: type IV secretory system conjugative DNA transfer family protein, partial [Desulfovibrionaceae bacterium]
MTQGERQYGLGGPKHKRNPRWLYLVFLAVLAVISMSVATQRIAVLYGPQPGLGKPWGRAFGVVWYAPWMVLVWRESLPDDYGFISRSVALGQAVFLLPQFLVLGLWLSRLRLSKGRKDLHGSARWAKEADIRDMGLLDGRGVYIGGWARPRPSLLRRFIGETSGTLYLRHNGPEHALCFAPTRSGKGVGLILPTLLSWPDSAVIFDIKGENWSFTAGWRKAQGQRVLRFDPSDASGASSRFNPLEEIRLDTVHAIQDAQNLVSMILDPQGKGFSDYWNRAAFGFLGGALLHCMVVVRSREQRSATLYDLSTMLADPARSIREVFEEMLATDHAALLAEMSPGGDNSADVHAFVAASAREMLNKADKELSGVVSTAVSNLALYRDPVVAANTARSDF